MDYFFLDLVNCHSHISQIRITTTQFIISHITVLCFIQTQGGSSSGGVWRADQTTAPRVCHGEGTGHHRGTQDCKGEGEGRTHIRLSWWQAIDRQIHLGILCSAISCHHFLIRCLSSSLVELCSPVVHAVLDPIPDCFKRRIIKMVPDAFLLIA